MDNGVKKCADCLYTGNDPSDYPCSICERGHGTDEKSFWAKKPEQDVINHPEHYTFGKHECIEEMQRMFGNDAVLHWCMCNVYKYRYRATHKNGAEDLKKADWYMDKVIELQKEAARL